MEFPTGEPIEQGISADKFKLGQVLTDFAKQAFSGYLTLAIDGATGIEEGIILFREGKIIASQYEYSKLGVTNLGEPALHETLNACKALHGVIDIFKLSKQQAELIVAFNDKIKIEKEIKDIQKEIIEKYSTHYRDQAIKKSEKEQQSKFEVMKKFGLTGVE